MAIVIDVLGAPEPRVWDAEQPFLYADDLAAIRGDGVFETLILREDVVRNTDRHASRFLSSAAMLELPAPDIQRWTAATELAVSEFARVYPEQHEAALRWVYSRGRESGGTPTGWITVTPVGEAQLKARREGINVMTAERGFSLDISDRSPWALIGAKTLSYAANMAALRAAKKAGFDDVIFLSEEGTVLEGPTSSVIIARESEGDGKPQLLTPCPHTGILPGTSQAAVFRLAAERGWPVAEAQLTDEDLRTAAGVWLVSSVRIQARVTAIDGQPMPRPAFADELEALIAEAVTAQA